MTDICGYDLGTRPYWMSEWQYDPCPCLLPKGHMATVNGRLRQMHECKHVREVKSEGKCGGLDPRHPGKICRFKAMHDGPCIDAGETEG